MSRNFEEQAFNNTIPLLQDSTLSTYHEQDEDEDGNHRDLGRRVWTESKKLWYIVGPAAFSRLATYFTFVITQAFAGHLGDLELAGISIAINVIIGFNVGFLLGMASALETLCGQAYGAKKYYMLGVYMQRSWIILFICCVLLLPFYIFATPILKLLGEPDDIAEASGIVSMYLIPVQFSLAFYFPLQRFLQSQMKSRAIACVSAVALAVHVILSWAFVSKLKMGLIGIAVTVCITWWILPIGLMAYSAFGGCPLAWTGFSIEAFSGLWDFFKLSVSSGVMLCLEYWYYRILIVMTGYMNNAKIAVDALSICMSINGLEMMIPLAFFAGTGVRVANELGAGNGKGAKFATIVSVVTSAIIGLIFCLLIMIFHDSLGRIFSSSPLVLQQVNNLFVLLAFTIFLNSIQPVLSGVAIGSGWQIYVAYINLGCYYLIGLPLGIFMEMAFDLGLKGIWGGMIFGGTAFQTLILIFITIRCDWEKEAHKATTNVKKLADAMFEN